MTAEGNLKERIEGVSRQSDPFHPGYPKALSAKCPPENGFESFCLLRLDALNIILHYLKHAVYFHPLKEHTGAASKRARRTFTHGSHLKRIIKS
jgi:hypothetical protein